MTIKELYKKYKGFNIELFGKPLEKQTIPFSFLPFDKKELNEMVVKDIKIKEQPFDAPRFDINLKRKCIDHYKGTVLAYCVKGE